MLRTARFTVTQKIAGSFLLNAAFSLLAILYVLSSMLLQNRQIEHVVEVDFRALSQARSLRENLQAQDRLEKQYLILRDPDLLDLLERRQHEFDTGWALFTALPLAPPMDPALVALCQTYLSARQQQVLEPQASSGDLDAIDQRPLVRARSRLLHGLDSFAEAHGLHIDGAMGGLSTDSATALRTGLFIVLFGMALGAPIGLSVIVSIHRSLRRLRGAVKQVSAGGFEVDLDGGPDDEFGRLAREFTEMGGRLRELEKDRLDANPLTYLPGNQAIHRAIEERVGASEAFAHSYVDLDNFKVYNDRYGYQAGDEVIAEVGRLIREAVSQIDDERALVGHIGGDDYVVLGTPDKAVSVAQRIIETFEDKVPEFYSAEDRAEGKLLGEDRFGVQREFPLMSLSIAIVNSTALEAPTATAVSEACIRLKKHLKDQPGSNFMVDRRSAA